MHGYNLWIHWWWTQDNAAIHTLEHQTNTTLYRPGQQGSSSSGYW
jgi:hypothetical protein